MTMPHLSKLLLSLFVAFPLFFFPTNSVCAATTFPKNILFYVGYGSYSMRISAWPLAKALSEKGHNVTYLSAHKLKDPYPRVNDFVPKKLAEWWANAERNMDLIGNRKSGKLKAFWYLKTKFGVEVCKVLYSDHETLEWIRKSTFDLIVIDSYLNECGYGLAHFFHAKTIAFSTFSVGPWYFDVYGIPLTESSSTSDVIFHYPAFEHGFISRVVSAVNPLAWKVLREYWYFPWLEEITKDGLGLDTVPSFSELEKNTSLIFMSTHYAQEYPRTFPPNVIPIGGLVLTGNTKPLPMAMTNFINKGKNGFIYISFGTMFEFADMDEEIKEAFVHALCQFPEIQFIWKSRSVGIDLPPNILVTKWAPQQDLLAHPKIVSFITHAGLGSINEAIYYGVPMILFPLFAEQDFNANFMEPRGVGIKLEILTLKSEQLQQAIKTMTIDERYERKMQKMSNLFKDRPMSPLETALWWTEYVLKHDSEELAEFLRPRSVGQSWWVRRQLDVWLFLVLSLIVIVSLTIYIVIFIYRWVKSFCTRKTRVRNHMKEKIK